MNLREGGTHSREEKGEKEGRSGRRELKPGAARWSEDGRHGGEAGLPISPAAADVWKAVLYGQSGCALARLELQESPEKPRRGEAARRVIRLSDCLRVAEASGEDSSPRDTSAFILETKERLYLLAAPSAERSDWMQAICLLAFPGQRKELPGPEGKSSQPCMEENELYSSTASVVPCKEFAVLIRPTKASERCRLRGSYTLRAGESTLELWGGPEPSSPLFEWPYRFLRRFGRDKVTFSFEAGRRCISGEGNFEFETQQGNEIFLALEEAISAQKNAPPPGPQPQPAMIPTVLPRPHDSLPPPSPTLLPAPRPPGPEGEYAVPFDAVARSLGKSFKCMLAGPPQIPADPLYDSIEETLCPQPDHIYDEPEGVATLSLYDSPQAPRPEARRRQAKAEVDPSGLQQVHPARQDLSASGWQPGTEYDNVVLKKSPK
ncbi:docking protein 2 isoform X1 [Otolemur garnettii]|uniref:docking protein 2 isoform X1 n=1 Tax=Otolemur garnettii TaxID=30611 RepID=UPI000C7EA61C|nr:docking protein 2 isoform X1 [Otolemur garnettii]